MKKISEEIESRDLSDVRKINYLTLFFKMYSLLEKEAVEVDFTSDDEIQNRKKLIAEIEEIRERF